MIKPLGDRAEAGRGLAARLQRYAHRRDVLVLDRDRIGVRRDYRSGKGRRNCVEPHRLPVIPALPKEVRFGPPTCGQSACKRRTLWCDG